MTQANELDPEFASDPAGMLQCWNRGTSPARETLMLPQLITGLYEALFGRHLPSGQAPYLAKEAFSGRRTRHAAASSVLHDAGPCPRWRLVSKLSLLPARRPPHAGRHHSRRQKPPRGRSSRPCGALMEIVKMLHNDPSLAFKIDPRKWEEIHRRSLQNGPVSNGGHSDAPRSGARPGRDRRQTRGWAVSDSLDSVKRYGPDHPVQPTMFVPFSGASPQTRTSQKGILTTTSTFAPMIPFRPVHQAPHSVQCLNWVDGHGVEQRLWDLAKTISARGVHVSKTSKLSKKFTPSATAKRIEATRFVAYELWMLARMCGHAEA